MANYLMNYEGTLAESFQEYMLDRKKAKEAEGGGKEAVEEGTT